MKDLSEIAGHLNVKILATDAVMESLRVGALHRFKRHPGDREMRVMARRLIDEWRYNWRPWMSQSGGLIMYFKPTVSDRVSVVTFKAHTILAMEGEFKKRAS